MTLNLSKHGAEMQAAWKKVCDAKDPTDWALYGYEGRYCGTLSRDRGECTIFRWFRLKFQ